MIPIELPTGWREVQIGEVLKFEYGKGLPKDRREKNGEFPVYGSSGIVGYHNHYLVNEDCIVVGRKGSIGSVFLSLNPCWPIDTTYYVKNVSSLNIKFLYYQLTYINLKIAEKSTAIPGLSRDDIYARRIILPPLEEQRQIVEIIEELFSELDAGRRQLESVKEQLKTYRQAVLKSAFEGKLTNENAKEGHLPEGWKWVKIVEVSESMKNGLYKPSSFYSDTGTACLRMYNINEGKIVWYDIKRMDISKDEIEDYKLLEGDLLINRVNSRELVGKTAYIENFHEPIVFESKNIRLRLKKEVNGKYLNYWFGLRANKYFNTNAQQTVGMASINQDQVSNFKFPKPNKREEQDFIVQLIESRLSVCEKLEETIETSLKQTETLKESILKQAFEGKLVITLTK